MAVYVDTFGNPDQVFQDFIALTGGAGSLGEINARGYPDLYQLTYGVPGASALCQRIKSLVDHPTGNIVVSGVPSSFPLADGNPITRKGGETSEDTTNVGEPVIRVIYDIGMCNGNGYWADGKSGQRINMPRAIILYHELSHAWHIANGTVAATEEDEEQVSEDDENIARQDKDEPLRLTTSHGGGCGNPKPGGYGNPWENACFVVAAVAGAESGAVVDSLRLVRDAAIRSIPMGHRLFEDLYREYYSYSPRIAKCLWADPHLRQAYSNAVVGPLLRVYATLAECLAHWPDLGAVDAVLERAMACEARAPRAQCDSLSTRLVDSLLSGRPDPDLAGSELVAHQHLVLSQWAIVRPLRAYWTIARGARPPTAPVVRAALLQWLSEQVTDAGVLCAAQESAKTLVEPLTSRRSGWPT